MEKFYIEKSFNAETDRELKSAGFQKFRIDFCNNWFLAEKRVYAYFQDLESARKWAYSQETGLIPEILKVV